jgi:SAM-dependent methyltransferase
MTLIEPPRKPVLDFGCGFGHLTRHLLRKVASQSIIGVEVDFIRLYLAKNFLAPEALYVCCDGNASLPFTNAFFSVEYSSDALYMVTNKVVCSREIQRGADSDGLSSSLAFKTDWSNLRDIRPCQITHMESYLMPCRIEFWPTPM